MPGHPGVFGPASIAYLCAPRPRQWRNGHCFGTRQATSTGDGGQLGRAVRTWRRWRCEGPFGPRPRRAVGIGAPPAALVPDEANGPTEQPEVDQLHPRAVLYPGNHPHMRHPAGTAFVSTWMWAWPSVPSSPLKNVMIGSPIIHSTALVGSVTTGALLQSRTTPELWAPLPHRGSPATSATGPAPRSFPKRRITLAIGTYRRSAATVMPRCRHRPRRAHTRR